MQMLQENESRKKVSLFATRQRIAVIRHLQSPTKNQPNLQEIKTKGSMMLLQCVLCVCLASIFLPVISFHN
ncbi:hypothetical protein HU200_014489 [Digitaria exilis]|uniref:Uncharacterized protein n=1 Tax=Digitaria exilis TaxID=1010633 RepID=A0A835FB16_9POAL|nr:hypothetical protein HU200_014489 [Digitaria exilis]